MTAWEVLETSGLVTVQDAGRAGLAHLGVPRAGWLDAPAARLANRLVGNEDGAAVLEVAMGGLRVRAGRAAWVAVTGAPCAVVVDGRARGWGRAERVAAGAELRLGPPTTGVRAYLAVAGGLAVEPVLGSRSTDTLAWVGPAPVTAGTRLPVGEPAGPPAAGDVPTSGAGSGPVALRLHPGPHLEWFPDDVLARLRGHEYRVGAASDRVGLRLEGTPVPRRSDAELPSEGMVLGAVQVPPDGGPVVLLADHPATGGYPVMGVVDPADLAACAQLRPGDAVVLRAAVSRVG